MILLNKKLQVFVSSTYTDLIEKRQAAVEAYKIVFFLQKHLKKGKMLFLKKIILMNTKHSGKRLNLI